MQRQFRVILVITLAIILFLTTKPSCSPEQNVRTDLAESVDLRMGTEQFPKMRALDSLADGNNPDQFLRTSFACWASQLRHRWEELPNYVSDLVIWGPSAAEYTSYGAHNSIFQFRWLHDRGVSLGGVFWPWRYGNSPLDSYYNTSFRAEQLAILGNDIENHSWSEHMDSVILGDEEPASGAYDWFSFGSNTWPLHLTKYNSTYHSETGFWFKSIFEMNRTELFWFHEWICNRTASAMNTIYDYVKGINPSREVLWSTIPWVGNEPGLWKSDRIYAQSFSSVPMHAYSTIRFYKTYAPETPVEAGLFGYPYLLGGYTSPDDLEKSFWLSYFAGADMISFFNQGWENIAQSGSTDQNLEAQYYDFISQLYEEGKNLRPIDCSPPILVIGAERGFATTKGAGLTSWDITNQRLVISGSVNLSDYDLVVVDHQVLLWENLVAELNEYVASGGNLVLLGSTSGSLENETGHLRKNLLEYETFDVTYQAYHDGERLYLDRPNAFDLHVESEEGVLRTAVNFTLTEDFTLLDTSFPEEDTDGQYSMFIYQNQSNPMAGQVFYCGLSSTEELFLDKLVAAFAHSRGLQEGISSDDTREMIIGIGKNSFDEVICGIINEAEQRIISVPISENYWGGAVPSRLNTYRVRYLDTTSAIYLDTTSNIDGFFHTADEFFADSIAYLMLGPEEPMPRIRVVPQQIDYTIAVGETFPVGVQFFCELGGTEIANLNVSISLPNNIEIVDSNPYQLSNLGNLAPNQPKNYAWLVQALQSGNFEIAIHATGTNCPIYNATLKIGVNPGRLSASVKESVVHVLPGNPVTIDLYINCYGQHPIETVSVDHLVWGYVWGNPGWVLNLSNLIVPGEVTHVGLEVHLTDPVPGEVGWYHLTVFSGDDYMVVVDLEIRIVDVVVESSLSIAHTTFMVGESTNLQLNLDSRGSAYAEDVVSTLLVPQGVEISPDPIVEWGDISPESMKTKTWNITFWNSGKYVLTLETDASNCPATRSDIEVVVFSSPKLILIPHEWNNTLEVIVSIEPVLESEMVLVWRAENSSTWIFVQPYSTIDNATFCFVIPWNTSLQFYLEFDRFIWPGMSDSNVIVYPSPPSHYEPITSDSLIVIVSLLGIGIVGGIAIGFLFAQFRAKKQASQ